LCSPAEHFKVVITAQKHCEYTLSSLGLIFECVSVLCYFDEQVVVAVLQVIQEHERAIVFRLGRAIEGRAKGPGLVWFIPWLDAIQTVDLRTMFFNIWPQEVLTADAVPLKVDAVVFFWVVDPFMWVMRVVNGPQAMSLLAQTTLKTMIGAHTLEDVLTQKLAVAKRMEMALCLEFKSRAGANVIAANGEVSVSHALVKAASTFEGNTVALQLRFLQSLLSMKSSARSVVVFPVPTEVSDVTVSSLP
uniref:Band 7 domain-containing protein n=1 Tax=Oreochromis aureus TaxID=47969 RepID=A0A668VGT3_OREAU